MSHLSDYVSRVGQGQAAAAFGCSQSMVSHLVTGRRRLTPERAMAIEQGTKRALRCEQLLPNFLWERDRRGRITGYRVAVLEIAA